MALTPLKKGARLRGGLGGSDGGAVTARAASEVRSWATQGGREAVAAWPNSGGPKVRDDEWGPPASRVRREGEGNAAGGTSP
jgi:hypothetical protein